MDLFSFLCLEFLSIPQYIDDLQFVYCTTVVFPFAICKKCKFFSDIEASDEQESNPQPDGSGEGTEPVGMRGWLQR